MQNQSNSLITFDTQLKTALELIDAVEDGYKDLKRLGLEREITTTSSESIIERKLPSEIKKELAKLVDDSVVDKTNKFPSLLNFLLSPKRAIEYDTAEVRNTSNPTIKGSAHNASTTRNTTAEDRSTPSPAAGLYSQFSQCLFHKEADHWTDDCKFYLSKSADGKMKMLQEKKLNILSKSRYNEDLIVVVYYISAGQTSLLQVR